VTNRPLSLSFEQLLDWVDGRLSERDAEEVARQVAAADADTQRLVAWLRAFRQASATTVLARPPAELRRQLRQRFKEERGRPGFFRRLVANLTFDSARQRPTAGVPRQLLYSTEVAAITLNLQTNSEGQQLTLLGRVSPFAATHQSYSVQLLRGNQEEAITLIGESGEFKIESITPGVYDMILSSEQVEVFITDIELHA
jgi:anti-sigma factor RsiW